MWWKNQQDRISRVNSFFLRNWHIFCVQNLKMQRNWETLTAVSRKILTKPWLSLLFITYTTLKSFDTLFTESIRLNLHHHLSRTMRVSAQTKIHRRLWTNNRSSIEFYQHIVSKQPVICDDTFKQYVASSASKNLPHLCLTLDKRIDVFHYFLEWRVSAMDRRYYRRKSTNCWRIGTEDQVHDDKKNK